MISLFKSPLSEYVSPDASLYSQFTAAIGEYKASQKSYVPLLLGMIRSDEATEAIFGVAAYKGLGKKRYYCIDFYEYQGCYSGEHAFTHVTTVGKSESTPSKLQLINAFDPKSEVSRVRLALDFIKDQNSKMAEVWVKRSLGDRVTKSNERAFVELVTRLLHQENISSRDLSLAKRLIDHLLERDPAHKIALGFLTQIGELYRVGSNGVAQDLFAAERYFLRVVQRDKTEVATRYALGLLYCNGIANEEEGYKFLLEVVALDPSHIDALNYLGELRANKDVYIAKYFFTRVLQQEPDNQIAKNGLARVEKRCSNEIRRNTVVDLIKTAEFEDAVDFIKEERNRLAEADDACKLLVSFSQAKGEPSDLRN